MSLFRKPGEDSSSDESSDDQEVRRDENADGLSGDLNLLSRINTLDSTGSGGATLSSRPVLSRNNSNVRDILLHSLIEEKALREAAQHLGKDVNDPEVQALARTTYQALSRQLSGPTGERYASDQMRTHRAAAQEGLEAMTRNHLFALNAAERSGSSSALISRAAPIRSLPALNPLFASLPSPIELPLHGYPGLHTDRYAREFIEVDVVGKGGYGKVYKVQHKLDNSFYAVKRIAVSPTRLRKIQENGPQEMEKMLEEVRALARFDHGNIVRYHNCWLEFTTTPADIPQPPTNLIRDTRLIEDVSDTDGRFGNLQIDLDSLSLGDPFGSQPDYGAGIVFEISDPDTGIDTEEHQDDIEFTNNKTPKQKRRRGSQASQATIATISSTRSRMSTIKSVNGEDDDDIESISRAHQPQYEHSSADLSESMMSNSDAPNQLISTRISGPVLTLNVQMSLYDTSLAAFLSPEELPSPSNHPHHCFHPCIGLELLSQIISGVEYLHTEGVVHRDLKPANVFLSLSTARMPPSGSVDLSSCRSCPARSCLHATPRIGDFGLVAALGNECLTSDAMTKPVGTEFYRPEGGDAKVSEKLDVFSLGVVAFEMLKKFSTRMERIDALTRLRRGDLPGGFADAVGVEGSDLIKDMTHVDERKRPLCGEVKDQLHKIVQNLRMQAQRENILHSEELSV